MVQCFCTYPLRLRYLNPYDSWEPTSLLLSTIPSSTPPSLPVSYYSLEMIWFLPNCILSRFQQWVISFSKTHHGRSLCKKGFMTIMFRTLEVCNQISKKFIGYSLIGSFCFNWYHISFSEENRLESWKKHLSFVTDTSHWRILIFKIQSGMNYIKRVRYKYS